MSSNDQENASLTNVYIYNDTYRPTCPLKNVYKQ